MLVDAFKNFRAVYFELYELFLAHCFTAPGLAWQAEFKKDQSKIRSFNWYRYVINDKKGVTGGIYPSVYW